MNEPRDPFALSAADYWDAPHKTMMDFAWDRVGEQISGIVLGGPPQLDVDVRSTLPMVAFHSDTLAGLVEAPFHAAIVVASRVDEPDLRAVVADEPEADDETAPPAEGFAGTPHDLELRELLNLPWKPATWIVTLLLRGSASNRVTVRLTRGALRYVDPEVERVLAEQRAAMRKPLPVPDDPALSFTRDGALDVPEERGIVLEGGAKLRLACRLPERAPVAAVWLVISGTISVGPHVRRLHLPLSEDGSGGVAELDLFADPAFAGMPPQTFFIHAFAGDVMSAPATMTLER
jgi:hypothetical protein